MSTKSENIARRTARFPEAPQGRYDGMNEAEFRHAVEQEFQSLYVLIAEIKAELEALAP